MDQDPLDLVAGTADAVVGTDEEGRIVIWNKAAERLLGHSAAEVLGKPCHDVLCGMDTFGNRFCDESCAVERMVRRREAVRHFELDLRSAAQKRIAASVSIVVVPGPRPTQHTVLHLLQPLQDGSDSFRLVERIGTPANLQQTPGPSRDVPSSPLTGREIEVLRLLADGTGTEEIANSLFISVTTVRNHVQNILRKLDVHSKLEAVSLALRGHLI
jgi:PAS domain S-box-containing protein